ncbi:MAG: quinol:electron acceptor oxidoreductase subunit ActD [Gemmatimonadota bacterium]
MDESTGTYGLMAEFPTPEALLAAAREAQGAGYRRLDAYSPMPVHGLAAALGFCRTNLPIVTFAGAVLGGIVGYGLRTGSTWSSTP